MKIDWSKTSVRLLNERGIGRSHWPSGVTSHHGWEKKSVLDNDLWYIFSGKGRIFIGKNSFELLPGTVLWLRPGREYRIIQEPNSPIAMNYIHFDLIEKDGSVRSHHSPLPPEVLFPMDIRFAESVSNRVVELWPWVGVPHPIRIPGNKEIASILMTGLVMHLDSETELSSGSVTSRTVRHHTNLVLSFANSIRENPAAHLSVKEIAGKAGYSREHFSRIFKKIMGISIESYEIEVKIIRAKEYLADTDMSIKEIASSLGYQTVYFFSRQFKDKTGVPPTFFKESSPAKHPLYSTSARRIAAARPGRRRRRQVKS